MSGLPPSHFQDFMTEFSQMKLGVLEKPFSLETLRKKIAHIQSTRKSGGMGSALAKAIVRPQSQLTTQPGP
jgi:hypothetical protein